MTKQAAKTGSPPTMMVAIEQNYPESLRIIEDNLAFYMLSPVPRIYARLARLSFIRKWMVHLTEKRVPGLWSMVMCRKRYIDEKAIEAVNGRFEAMVNLGAGLDTRAYRFPDLRKLSVFEVDQTENINKKRVKLKNIFGDIPEHVTLVTVDFDREDLAAAMVSNGYIPDMKTFFILEGVTQYLDETGIEHTFNFLSQAGAGSRLVFTYICDDFLNGNGHYQQDFLYRQTVLKDNAWRFGMSPETVNDFLNRYGWRVISEDTYPDLAERYVRPAGRSLQSITFERLVLAEKL